MSPQSDRTLDCWEPTRCTSDINFISLTQLQTLHLQYISLKSWYSERDNKNDGLQFITVENVTVLWFPFKNFIPVITLVAILEMVTSRLSVCELCDRNSCVIKHIIEIKQAIKQKAANCRRVGPQRALFKPSKEHCLKSVVHSVAFRAWPSLFC